MSSSTPTINQGYEGPKSYVNSKSKRKKLAKYMREYNAKKRVKHRYNLRERRPIVSLPKDDNITEMLNRKFEVIKQTATISMDGVSKGNRVKWGKTIDCNPMDPKQDIGEAHNYVLHLRSDTNNDFTKWLIVQPSRNKKAGLGLFTARPFEKGDLVTVYLGVIKTQQSTLEHGGKYAMSAANGKYIDALGPPSEHPLWLGAHMINEPRYEKNANVVCDGHCIIATRKILPHTELLMLYKPQN